MFTNRNKITVYADDEEFGAVLNCAVRYSMGRMTYMPSLVIGFIMPLLPKLSDRTLSCFDRDLSEPAIYGGLGDENIDAPLWQKFHAEVRQEIQIRKDLKRWQQQKK